MTTDFSQTVVVGPYSLMEEEALAWSILLFQKAVLLHPFPLPMPSSFDQLMNQGLLKIRIPDRSPEEIKVKDRNIREIEAFISGMPEQSFLRYLHEVSFQDDKETQEEIVGLMKGVHTERFAEKKAPIDGQLLLILIHKWIMEQWDLEAALAKVEEQEKRLARNWQEDPEEGAMGSQEVPQPIRKGEKELPCPLALRAWKELKNELVPEPSLLFTSQSWVWKDRFGVDWEESPTLTVPLPELSLQGNDSFQKLLEKGPVENIFQPIREAGKLLASGFFSKDLQKVRSIWEQSLAVLDRGGQSRYKLILPLIQSPAHSLTGPGERNRISPLVLITAN
jgi:hypothetical protein